MTEVATDENEKRFDWAMGSVTVEFTRPVSLASGAIYGAGERASVTQAEADDLCSQIPPAATLFISKAVDAPPVSKMVTQPQRKKGNHG